MSRSVAKRSGARAAALPLAMLAALYLSERAQAQGAETAGLPRDLTELALDGLLKIEVSTVSKRPERAGAAAAAVFVVTGEDTRRSGARSLAEALRLVPGLQVSRASATSLRSGRAIGKYGHARVYAKGFERDPAERADGSEVLDSQRHLQTGFGSDWVPYGRHALTVSGDLYDGRQGSANGSTDVRGGNLLARWSFAPAAEAGWSAQLYYDRYERLIPTVFSETRDTLDAGFQQRLTLGRRHSLIYGLGVSSSHDVTGGPPLAIIFEPASRTLNTYSAFAQDQVRWLDGTLTLTFGSKFEHNDFTGFEVQPSLRLGWQASEQWFTWGAVSRAVRTPNRLNRDIAIFCAPQFADVLGCEPGTRLPVGSRDFDSESLIAYEWGLRWWSTHRFSAALAAYFNDYSDLRSSEPGGMFLRFDNGLHGHGYGAELTLAWQPSVMTTLRAVHTAGRCSTSARRATVPT